EQALKVWPEPTAAVSKPPPAERAGARRPGQPLNPIHAMVASGARGSRGQIGQLAGMRGLMTRPSGAVLETPIKASFREGLSSLEYFTSTHGARKGLVDTAMKTSDSGYLTRKLVAVAQHVVVTLDACRTPLGIAKGPLVHEAAVLRGLADAVRGRVSRSAHHPVVAENELITARQAKALEALGLAAVSVRSPLTCQAPRGVCR